MLAVKYHISEAYRNVWQYGVGAWLYIGANQCFSKHGHHCWGGVERTFPVHSPNIDSIKVVFRGDVRRAKLYYLRNLRGKAARIKEKR